MKKRTYINSRNVRANTVRGIPKKQPPAPQGAFGNLIPDIQRAVAAEGYETPTPIQEQCIPHLLKGRDLMGTAQTGTGKTAAFTLPLLQRLSDDTRRPQRSTPRALILAPTRELAAQIDASVRVYGRFVRVNHTLVHGGVSQFAQIKALKHGVDILVATPGRLLDLMEQGHIHLDQVEVFILDEVDRMLDMGFIPDIKRVLSKLPEDRQTLFFSATIPPKIVALAHAMVVNPVQISISPDQPAVELIAQKVLFVGKKSKDALLISLLRDKRINKALIFTQMKHSANRVAKKLHAAGIQGTAIHGNKSQAARTRALDGFKRGRFRVLVATDVAARGLDVDDITHVINYDLPLEAEIYVHRIGRTGRAGEKGDAISFCSAGERACLRDIERFLGEPVPTDLEHEFHCDDAFHFHQPSQKRSMRGGGKTNSGRPRGNSPPFRGRRRYRGAANRGRHGALHHAASPPRKSR